MKELIEYLEQQLTYAKGTGAGVSVISNKPLELCIDALKQAEPTKHGHWEVREGESSSEDGGRCSLCGCDMPQFISDWRMVYVTTDYCPNCGAKMDLEVEK